VLQSVRERTGRFVPRLAQQTFTRLRLSLPVRDRFVQEFPREYGDIWSEQVLVEVPPAYLTLASDEYQTEVNRHEHRVHRTVVSVAIVLATIVAAYLLLNTITLSYFSGRLRVAAIFCALAALAVATAAIVA